ncbi:mycothiol maleylpyruvate isomerase [Streptomyces sp. AcH 505]|uniref:maleylpyruvate isomerase family mycothiol-dependent enzyme n=1 Tax=unclassified Streptomyces TaxID=2593676 RepID=UPI0005920372|nr:maleylpyruvate isomerase family mycothiol-dependent enzyme [Streptomyces sp. NBC_00370]KIF70395.1 mycothiol maleylpyruvate isomerase [Streptomyces sp. AcH 505]
MTDHVRDLASVHEATERLLTAAAGLDNAALAAPSRLPGWSRGHLLAHIARNADALVNVLEGRPMYKDAKARQADIDRDAPRPLEAQLSDVRESAARFERAASAPADWSRTITMRNGVTDTAARVPFRRWGEIELHHIDLDVGRTLDDLSDEFTGREIDFLAERFAGNADVPPLALTTPDGRTRHTGSTDGTPLAVSGPAGRLMGWLAGRTDTARLSSPDGPLPVLPPL